MWMGGSQGVIFEGWFGQRLGLSLKDKHVPKKQVLERGSQGQTTSNQTNVHKTREESHIASTSS